MEEIELKLKIEKICDFLGNEMGKMREVEENWRKVKK